MLDVERRQFVSCVRSGRPTAIWPRIKIAHVLFLWNSLLRNVLNLIFERQLIIFLVTFEFEDKFPQNSLSFCLKFSYTLIFTEKCVFS